MSATLAFCNPGEVFESICKKTTFVSLVIEILQKRQFFCLGAKAFFSLPETSVFSFCFFRIMSTMTMSSLWHGVKPGYWICFYSTPYFGLVEALYRSTIRRRLPSRRALLVYDL